MPAVRKFSCSIFQVISALFFTMVELVTLFYHRYFVPLEDILSQCITNRL